MGGKTTSHASGTAASIREALDDVAARLENGHLAGQPLARATLHATLGRTYASDSLYDPRAEEHLRQALAIDVELENVCEGLREAYRLPELGLTQQRYVKLHRVEPRLRADRFVAWPLGPAARKAVYEHRRTAVAQPRYSTRRRRLPELIDAVRLGSVITCQHIKGRSAGFQNLGLKALENREEEIAVIATH